MRPINVTEDEFKRYLEEFHSSLDETAKTFLPDHARELLHMSLLPARIVGYVSTQYGVAFEYIPSETTSVEVIRGSARVEDLLFDPPPKLTGAPGFVETDMRCLDIQQAIVRDRFPVRLQGASARMSISQTICLAEGWKRSVHYAELYGDRSSELWSVAQAVSKAKDEVLAGMFEISQARKKALALPEYISRIKSKAVLLLGDYGEDGAQRLGAIGAVLCELGYEPVLVADIPDNPPQDLSQKVSMLGSLTRFVVVDDSSKSGHLAELPLCQSNRWITVVLRAEGIGSSWMTAGISASSRVMTELSFVSSSPRSAVEQAVRWAEETIRDLGVRFDSAYPWRRKPTDGH